MSVPAIRSIRNAVEVDYRPSRHDRATDTAIRQEADGIGRPGDEHDPRDGRIGSGPQPAGGAARAAGRPGVVVVDEDDALRHFLNVGLTDAGFRVYATSGEAQALAIAAVPNLQLDVVLLDLCTPRADGPQVLQELRVLRPGLQGCYMSGSPAGGEEFFLRQWGASRVVTKPVRLREVIEVLAAAVGDVRGAG